MPPGEAAFFLAAQAVDSPRENAPVDWARVSGPTIFAYVGGDPLSAVDPNGMFWEEVGKAAVGAAIEIGLQGAVLYWRGCDVLDWNNYNWTMVAISAATSTVAPGWFSIGKRAPGAVKAVATLMEQSGRARTANRAAKIKTRIAKNVKSVADPLITQGMFQSFKALGKQITDNEDEDCTCAK